MARPRTVDRDQVLDAFEAVVLRGGAAASSFASVADAAGISKASVQSAFGTRAAMIDALIGRWMSQESERYAAALGGSASPDARLAAHLRSTMDELLDDRGQRVATLLAILASEGGRSDSVRAWYRDRLGDLGAASEADRRRRAVYLAAEGAFFLRCLVGLDVDETVWADVFADLGRMIER